MKRILIFSLVYYPKFVGGAEVAIKEITDRISSDSFLSRKIVTPAEESLSLDFREAKRREISSPREGGTREAIEFDMITLNGGHELALEKVGNVTVYRVFTEACLLTGKVGPLQKLLFPFIAFFKALKLHRVREYDVVWSIMANYAGFAALFFKIFKPKVKFILTLQEGDSFEHIRRRVGILYPLFKRIFTKADRIQTISNYLADWAKSMGTKCPIEVVPNGVDFDHFSKAITLEEKHLLRKDLGLGDSDIVLVTASRLVYKNAVDDIISALQYLPSSYKLLILGTGEEENKLKVKSEKLKFGNRVVFKGFVPHSELPQYLQPSDIFIRPSRSEGLGNAFLEAMAAGIPVIATPVGGIPDFLKDGETGLFCEVNNPKSIAQKVEKLTKDMESKNYIVSNARNMVREKYGWEGIAEKMRDIFVV